MNSIGEFNDRLKSKRNDFGLSQKELANIIGVSVTTIQKYESGQTVPKGPHLVSLAKALECSIDWLMTGTNSTSTTLDRNLLQDIIWGVDQWLSERKLELDHNSKSELISLLYDQFVSDSGQYNSRTLERFMRLGTR